MTLNFYYYLLPTIISGIVNLVILIPVKTYYLSPKDFGVLAILAAISSIIIPLSSTGSTWILAANYFKSTADERGKLLFNILLLDFLLKLFWIALFWLLGPYLLPMLIKNFEQHYGMYFNLVLLASLATVLWPTTSYFFILQQSARLHAVLEFSQWITGALVTVLCLWLLKLSTISLFIGPLAAGVVSLFACLWTIRKHVRVSISKKWMAEIIKYGLPTIPSNMLEMLTNFTDRHFIQKWFSLTQLGIYSHAASYREMFTAGSRAFTRSFIPSVADTFSNDRDTSSIARTLKMWYSVLAIGGLFVVFFSYDFTNLLTHGKFNEAAPLIPIWFLVVLSIVYGVPYTQFLLVRKKNHFMVFSSIVSGALFICITAFSIYAFGSIGAVISIVLANFAIHLPRRIYASRLGCPAIAEKEFLLTVSLIVAVYVLNGAIDTTFVVRSILWILLSFASAYYSGLADAVVTRGKKMLSSGAVRFW